MSLEIQGPLMVDDLQEAIENELGIGRAAQFLVFSGRKIEPGHRLQDYGIYKDCVVDLVLGVQTRTVESTKSARYLDQLIEFFPNIPPADLSRILSYFPPKALDDAAAFILMHGCAQPSEFSLLSALNPDKSEEEIHAALEEGGADPCLALFLLQSSGTRAMIADQEVSTVNIFSLIEVDMHGPDYTPSQWSAVICWLVELCCLFGIDKLCLITGLGRHSRAGQPLKLRPTAMATLALNGYHPHIDQINPGLVWCDIGMTAEREDEEDDVTEKDSADLRALKEEFPDFPRQVLCDLLTMSSRDLAKARNRASELSDQMNMNWSAVMDPESVRVFDVIGKNLFNDMRSFKHVPKFIIRKLNYSEISDRREQLKFADDAIREGRVKSEELEELFKHVRNADLPMLVRALEAEGNVDDALAFLVKTTRDRLENKVKSFKFTMKLNGTRANGEARLKPILAVDVVQASRENAESSIGRVLDEVCCLDNPDYKEVHIICPYLTPRVGMDVRSIYGFVMKEYGGMLSVKQARETIVVRKRKEGDIRDPEQGHYRGRPRLELGGPRKPKPKSHGNYTQKKHRHNK